MAVKGKIVRENGLISEQRRSMLADLERRGISDPRVLAVLGQLPRELFLEHTFATRAYEDSALPIGDGQTISQPFTVAFQTQALQLQGTEKVLEIGTGSGYQSAVLAALGVRLYTIERHIRLLEQARKRLENLGHHRVISRAGDGTRGWPEYAPFDAILVAAGAPDVPESLANQLNPDGGRMVIPVGDHEQQTMYLVRRDANGFHAEELADFAFVPLVGKEGWAS